MRGLGAELRRDGVGKEKDGDGKNENEGTDEEPEVKMEVARDGVKAPVHAGQYVAKSWNVQRFIEGRDLLEQQARESVCFVLPVLWDALRRA